MSADMARDITFVISVLVMSFILLQAVNLIIRTAAQKMASGRSLLSEALTEKTTPAPNATANATGGAKQQAATVETPEGAKLPDAAGGIAGTAQQHNVSDGGQQAQVGSFSRVSGAIGAMALATAVIGISYWLLYALFFCKTLATLKDTSWFFLSGSALFSPYAFNQLSSTFKWKI